MDVANLILESYQKFGFITAETIDSMRNAQRLKVVQVWRRATAVFELYRKSETLWAKTYISYIPVLFYKYKCDLSRLLSAIQLRKKRLVRNKHSAKFCEVCMKLKIDLSQVKFFISLLVLIRASRTVWEEMLWDPWEWKPVCLSKRNWNSCMLFSR